MSGVQGYDAELYRRVSAIEDVLKGYLDVHQVLDAMGRFELRVMHALEDMRMLVVHRGEENETRFQSLGQRTAATEKRVSDSNRQLAQIRPQLDEMNRNLKDILEILRTSRSKT